MKLVKTKNKWDKEEYIALLENLILNHQTDLASKPCKDSMKEREQPDIDKITNEIKLLSTD